MPKDWLKKTCEGMCWRYNKRVGRYSSNLYLIASLVGVAACSSSSPSIEPLADFPITTPSPLREEFRNEDEKRLLDLSKWTLREKIGQLLIIGYRDDQQIRDLQPGGVALFSWSLKSIPQTRELTAHIRNMAERYSKAPLLIATDHEGGKVIRLRNGMTLFPEASALGTSLDSGLARRVGRAVGTELAYLGVNANFGPVLDIGGADSFLGNRLWGEDPLQVATMTGAYINGMQEAGVMSVAKHFPGHGPSSDDAHFSVPVNHKKLGPLLGEDLLPFRRAVIEKVPAIMTAHVRVPEVDRLPASMSSRFLSRILRDTFKFEGVIVTDDLEMKGAQDSLMTPGDLALQALVAGSDMLLVVWSKVDQRKIVARIEKAIRRGEWSEAELDRKVRRVMRMKSTWIGNEAWRSEHSLSQPPMRSPEHLRLVDEIASKPVRWVSRDESPRQRLHQRRHETWRVALPQNPEYLRFWKSYRPQDEILVHDKRLSTSALGILRSRLSASSCASRVCVVVTEAGGQSPEGLIKHVRELVDLSPALWAHMGLKPRLGNALPSGAVAVLGATGVVRLRQLSNEIEKP